MRLKRYLAHRTFSPVGLLLVASVATSSFGMVFTPITCVVLSIAWACSNGVFKLVRSSGVIKRL